MTSRRPYARRRSWAIAFGVLLLLGQLVLLVHASAGPSHDPSCPVCQVAHSPALLPAIPAGLPPPVYADPPFIAVSATPPQQLRFAAFQRGPPAIQLA